MKRALQWAYLVGGCLLGAISGVILIGMACRGVLQDPPRLTWSASFFASKVDDCRAWIEPKADAEIAESYCNCLIPELMRASPSPTGEITHAEVEQATKACIHLVPDHKPAAAPEPNEGATVPTFEDDTRRSM